MADTSGVSETGLELWLEFEDDLTDSSANSRDQSSAIGAAEFTSEGAPGTAGRFRWQKKNYIDTGVQTLGTASLFADTGEAWSVAVWVRFPVPGAGTIISRQSGTGAQSLANNALFIHRPSSGADQLLVRIRGADNYYPLEFADSEWHHVVLTWNGTAARLFIDNVEKTAPSVGGVSEPPVNIFIAGADLDLDADEQPTSNLSGDLDDLRVYSRALSATEVSLLFAYGGGDTEDDSSTIVPQDLELLLQYEGDLTDGSVNGRDQGSNLQNGPLTFTTGKVGSQAATFDASSSQYIDTGVNSIGDCDLYADSGSAWSVSGWFKYDGSGGIGVMVDKHDGANIGLFRLRITTTDIELRLRGTTNLYSPFTNNDGEWHHVAVTWDGSSAKIYRDGTELSAPSVGANTDLGTENILIGAAQTTIGGLIGVEFDSHMDDLRFYSRALTESEVEEVFGATPKFSTTLELTSISGSTGSFTVTFGDNVDTFVSGDITTTNGTVSNVQQTSSTVWTFDVTADADGTVTVQIAEDAVDNSDGDNTNKASDIVGFGVGSVADPDGDGLLLFDRTATQNVAASIIIGPVPLSPSADRKTMIQRMRSIFASGTDATGTIGVACGVDGEDAANRADNDAEQFSATISNVTANNNTTYPRVAGYAATFVIDVTSGHCILEQIELQGRDAGRNRGSRYSA